MLIYQPREFIILYQVVAGVVNSLTDISQYGYSFSLQNWHNRRKPEPVGDINMHKPLFDIHTFNSSQISSDPRVKLESKLRQAGLHTTDYARQILSKVEPPKPPRKDTLHTLKLGD